MMKSIIISRNVALRVEQAVILNQFFLFLPTDIQNCGEHSQGKSSSWQGHQFSIKIDL